MIRIALSGVFDIPNYGDHLFPLMLKEFAASQAIDCEIVLFSPLGGQESFVEDSHVYSLDNLEQMHQTEPFDAIVVGGGEIIHWHRYPQKYSLDDETYLVYPMDKVWLVPFLMKIKYGTKILWNCPGIPYDFTQAQALAKFIFSGVDYISVRNHFSKNVLIESGIEPDKVFVYPDTGFAMSKYISEDELKPLRQRLFPTDQPYIVFHCNRFIDEADRASIKELLLEIKSRGYHVLLLPLAFTHGDDEILRLINADAEYSFTLLDNELTIHDIISLISGCSLYIGTSLHGAVTATAYGRPVVSFDYQKTRKTQDLFESLGLSDFYLTSADGLMQAADTALDDQKKIEIHSIHHKIETHFDRLFSLISSPVDSNDTSNSSITTLEDHLYDLFRLHYQSEGQIEQIGQLSGALHFYVQQAETFKNRAEYAETELMKRQTVRDVAHIRLSERSSIYRRLHSFWSRLTQ